MNLLVKILQPGNGGVIIQGDPKINVLSLKHHNFMVGELEFIEYDYLEDKQHIDHLNCSKSISDFIVTVFFFFFVFILFSFF